MASRESDEKAAKGKKPTRPVAAASKPSSKPATSKKPAAAAKKPAKAPPEPVEIEATEAVPAKPAKSAAKKSAPAVPVAKPRPEKRPAPRTPIPTDDEFDSAADDEGEGTTIHVPPPRLPTAQVAEAAVEAPLRKPGVEEEAEEVEPAAVGGEAAPKPKKVVKIPPMPSRRSDGTITIAYSADADDAFMFYALESGKVDTEGRKYQTTRADIETLNEEAKKGTHDVTAISFAAYPVVYERYLLLPCGSSFGDQQGPILVSSSPVRPNEVDGLVVAVPGALTTATLVLRLWLPRANLRLVAAPFDKIGALVKARKVRSGLLIHEGQLTWREEGLVRVIDFGQWWGERTEGLPLPLGANAIRRDIPAADRAKIALDIKRSIAYALGHREEALAYALGFARGMDKAKVDRFVSMYVNELTLDLGERGRQAAKMLLDEAHRHGLIPRTVDLDFE